MPVITVKGSIESINGEDAVVPESPIPENAVSVKYDGDSNTYSYIIEDEA